MFCLGICSVDSWKECVSICFCWLVFCSSGLKSFWHQGPISWKTIFPRTEDRGWFWGASMHIYCAFYFQCYYISSTSDHQALDPRGWGPPFYRIRSCWLLIQQLLREEVLKLLTVIMYLPISPFNSISFCLVCFIVLLFGAYAFGLAMFSWWIDPFYNYPMSLPVSGKFLCSEAYFIGYQPIPFSFDLLIIFL